VAAVRREQAAGRIRPGTQLLHLAPSFQAWIATPLGVFTGVLETIASDDRDDGPRTIGGRLRDVAEVDQLLGPDFPYLAIEGYGPQDGYTDLALRAGYRAVASGDGWSLLRLP
jgi:hypothetical protein